MAEHGCSGAACPCGIDVHAHVVPENFPSYIGSVVPPDWPSMAAAQPCHRSVMIAGKNYRTVSDKCWSTPKRLADLPSMGLSLQVVSPMPELLSYWMPAPAGSQLVRHLNDAMAEMVAASDGHLRAFGAVPLQDPDLAIQELHYLIETLGFAGVEIGSNINGRPVGDPLFDGFFQACESLGAAVFVHALRPIGMERLLGPPALQQVLAYPSDVGLAAASVITTNLLVRQPGLRMAFSHGGGTLAMLLPRLEQAVSVFPALKDGLLESPTAQARRLFFDTLVFDPATLHHLVHLFGATQLKIGTDYPFNFHDANPVDRLMAAGLDEAALHGLLHGNARRFLGMAA
jgi:aminocarboxymuconate-semialdehyde decarboxylase